MENENRNLIFVSLRVKPMNPSKAPNERKSEVKYPKYLRKLNPGVAKD